MNISANEIAIHAQLVGQFHHSKGRIVIMCLYNGHYAVHEGLLFCLHFRLIGQVTTLFALGHLLLHMEYSLNSLLQF